MQWEFTPEEVVKGEIDYGLYTFRHDLYQEVRANIASDDENFMQHSFDIIYDLCYWLATGREFDDFVVTIGDDTPLDAHILQAIKEHMRENITMLGAILQRMILNALEQGMPIEQAIDTVAKQHAAMVM